MVPGDSGINHQGAFSVNVEHHDKQQTSSTLQERLRALLSTVVKDADQRTLIGELKGDEAQIMADYLNAVLHEAGILGNDDGKYILSCLCTLAKLAEVYPQCYVLRGIQKETHPRASGGFADVYQGIYGNQRLCLKVIRVYQRKNQVQVLTKNLKEMVLWAHLSHQNILPFYGVYFLDEAARQMCLVSPWMEQGNLEEYLSAHPEAPRMLLVMDVIEGVSYLHRSNIVHSDLKSENVLVSDEGRALIADFGISNVVTTSRVAPTKSPNGTARWKAPELLEGDEANVRATKRSDVWSLGCLCYKIITRKVPFYEYRTDYKVIAILSAGCKIPKRPTPGIDCDGIDDTMWGLLEKCWDYAPQKRPLCEEIRDFILKLQIKDDRPGTLARSDNNPAFWEAMRAKSDIELEYDHVERILLGIQQSQSSWRLSDL